MKNINLKKFDIIYITIGVAFVIIGLFLPKSGKLALVDVACDSVLLWGIVIYLFLKIKKLSGGLRKNYSLYIVCLGVCIFSGFITKDLVMDLIEGPQRIELYKSEITKLQGVKGMASLHYYLEGEDVEGNSYKLEISADDYANIDASGPVIVNYYKNTERLYDVGGIE